MSLRGYTNEQLLALDRVEDVEIVDGHKVIAFLDYTKRYWFIVNQSLSELAYQASFARE